MRTERTEEKYCRQALRMTASYEELDEGIHEAGHTIIHDHEISNQEDTSGDKAVILIEDIQACSNAVVAENSITHDRESSRRKKARTELPKS